MDSDGENNVHERVERLSITVKDSKRKEIAAFLKEAKNEEMNKNTRIKPKRRRSSVQQGAQIRKKKLLVPPEIKMDMHYTKKKIGMGDMRELVLWMLTVYNAAPTWINVINRTVIDRVVFLFVPGLCSGDFGHQSFQHVISPQPLNKVNSNLSKLSEIFPFVLPVQAPGSKEALFSSMYALTNCPLTKKEREVKIKEDSKKKIILPDLLMLPEQLSQHSYPLHPDVGGSSDCEGFVDTQAFDHDGSHTFALDCEMCEAASGKVLTRISLLDFNNKVILDTLVKPKEEITNYLTQYSGITPEALEHVETTLEDVQKKMCGIVSSRDILVGHSLESDLNVLKMRHPKIVDTAIIYEHPRGPPAKCSLKYLAKTYLKRDIQAGSEGHSSVEDSEACMDLVKLKIQNGLNFGKNKSEESLYERVFKKSSKNHPGSSVLIDYASNKFGEDTSPRYEKKIQCYSDDEVVDQITGSVKDNMLIVAKMRELEFEKGYSPRSKAVLEYNESQDVALSDVENCYLKLNERIAKVYSALPLNTAFIVCSGNGDPREMLEWQKKKREFQKTYDASKADSATVDWNLETLGKLKAATAKAKDALCLMTVKTATVSEEEEEEESAILSDN